MKILMVRWIYTPHLVIYFLSGRWYLFQDKKNDSSDVKGQDIQVAFQRGVQKWCEKSWKAASIDYRFTEHSLRVTQYSWILVT